MGGLKSWFEKKASPSPYMEGSVPSFRGTGNGSQSGQYQHLPAEPGKRVATSSMESSPSANPPDSQGPPASQPSVYTTSGTATSAMSSGPPISSSDNNTSSSSIPPEKQYYPVVSQSGRATFVQGGIQKYSEQSGTVESENSRCVVAQTGLEIGTGQDQKVEAHEEVLVNIPGTMVHLIDQDGSALLTMGDLQLLRITQEGRGVVAIVKIGDDLQWPLGWDEPVFKINSHRFVFTLRVPDGVDDDASQSNLNKPGDADSGDEHHHYSGSNFTNATAMPGGVSSTDGEGKDGDGGVMSYGVTFVEPVPSATLQHFDKCLKQYCVFSEPQMVASQGVGATAAFSSAAPPFHVAQNGNTENSLGDHTAVLSASKENVESATKLAKMSAAASFTGDRGKEGQQNLAIVSRDFVEEESGLVVPTNPETRKLAEKNAAYWTIVAPNVDDYRGSIARGIATGSGGVIKGIFYVSDATSSRLERIGTFAKSKLKQGDPEKPMKISPAMMKSMKRARTLSKMTAKVADSILAGVITTTGVVTGVIIKRTIFNTAVGRFLPGDVAIVSLDAFARLFDAVELAGKNVLNTTSVVTSGVVSHKFGEQAGELTTHGLATTGHMIHTAWTVSKIRKALTPSKAGVPKLSTAQVAKGAIKGVLRGAKS